MYELRYLPGAERFFKKLKEKGLKVAYGPSGIISKVSSSSSGLSTMHAPFIKYFEITP